MTDITTTTERPDMTVSVGRSYGLIGFIKKVEVESQHSVRTVTQVITYRAVCYDIMDNIYHTFPVSEREYHNLFHWRSSRCLIQDALPDMPTVKRELCISGVLLEVTDVS